MSKSAAWSRIEGLAEHVADRLNAAIHARYLKRPQAFCSLGDAKKLLLTADYSGDQSDSRYRTVGLLLVNEEDLESWKTRLAGVRRAGLGRRRLSYKDLRHDAIKWKALPHFLESAGPLRGYCLAVAFAKELAPLVEDVASHKGLLAPLAKWPKALRLWALYVTAVEGIIITSTCQDDTDFVVVTDEDELAANPKRLEEFVNLLNVTVGQLSSKRFNKIVFRTTQMPTKNLFVEDLCTLPDLVGGALMDLLRSAGGKASQDPLQVESSMLDVRAKVLIGWMLTEGNGLTRLAAIIDGAPPPNTARVRLLCRNAEARSG